MIYSKNLSNLFKTFTKCFIEQITKNVPKEELPYVLTHTGLKFRHARPEPEDIDIVDIAHALSRICRYTGHVNCKHYSVAEHSVRVSFRVPKEDALEALLHDASEAYCNDISRPFKRMPGMEAYQYYENLTSEAINKKFNLRPEPESVQTADRRMLGTEQRDLMPGSIIDFEPYSEIIIPWNQWDSEYKFLSRFYQLQELRKVSNVRDVSIRKDNLRSEVCTRS